MLFAELRVMNDVKLHCRGDVIMYVACCVVENVAKGRKELLPTRIELVTFRL